MTETNVSGAVLVSALHDGSRRLLERADELWPEIVAIYERAVVVVSDQSAPY